MALELKKNNNTPLCFIGIQGSPTCSINWGKHKINKYKTESIELDTTCEEVEENHVYGVMTEILNEMLKEYDITIPYFEAPVKESMESEQVKNFFCELDNLMKVPEEYRYKYNKLSKEN